MEQEQILCPSSRCQAGALLVGIVLSDGRVAYASDRIVIDREFVELAQQGPAPETRFRFSTPCARGACRQWTGDRCGVIDRLTPLLDEAEQRGIELPACAIRAECRWFAQAGATACAICPEVVTDMTASDCTAPQG